MEVYKSGKDALEGASSVEALKSVKRQNVWKPSLKVMVTLTRTRSRELLASAPTLSPDGQQSQPKMGGKPLQPTPAIYTINVAQLSQKHMINVFEDNGGIKTLMTANESKFDNRAASLLTHCGIMR